MATSQSENNSYKFEQKISTEKDLEKAIYEEDPSQYSIFDVDGYFQPVDVCRMLADMVDEGIVIENHEIRNIADTFRESTRPEGVSDEFHSRVEAIESIETLLNGWETDQIEAEYDERVMIETEFYVLE